MEEFGGLCTYKCMCGIGLHMGLLSWCRGPFLGVESFFCLEICPRVFMPNVKRERAERRVYGEWKSFNQSKKKGKKEDWSC
jgi:hypothetical protein